MEKARSEGMVRFLGITGHEDPEILKMMLERYQFDNALVALNAADKHYNSYIEEFLPLAVERGIGIVGMKILPGTGFLTRWYYNHEGGYGLCYDTACEHNYHRN
ncbi:MAG: hypothetical protein R2727_05975 [Bacteroidales bacterium]